MTTCIAPCVTVALLGLMVATASVSAAMPPYVCPGTPCPECNYEGVGDINYAALFGQPCDPVNNPCNGTLMCCTVKGVGLRCTDPVATAPRNGSCPRRPAVLPRRPGRQCPEDMGLSCTYDSECEKPGYKCCMDYECCGSIPGCQKHKCVKPQ